MITRNVPASDGGTLVASPQQRQGSIGPVLPAMLGAICCSVVGTLITSSLHLSPTTRVVAAAGCAALAPMIATVGRLHHLRIGAGLMITIVALAVTYGGFAVVDSATGRTDPHLPLPSVGGTGNLGRFSGNPTKTGLHIKAGPSPLELDCDDTAKACEGTVSVSNEGTLPLRIGEIELRGPAAAAYSHTGCEHQTLPLHSDPCQITVRRQTATAGTARLIIHQNLPGAPTEVEVTSDQTGGGEVTGPLMLTPCATPTDGAACPIKGTGFKPGETVELTYTWPSGARSQYQVATAGDGSFEHQLLRASPPGTIEVSAVGRTSGRTTSTSYTPSSLNSPQQRSGRAIRAR
ncbi:hypothetical protein E1293_07945 [Actinomadura darangshiensis]|uniref:Uncharacterized protein n=1 Tax=Actinomadura darangshiensis TaxID=705336 RepID=A0A4R5BQ41_9ACTN|nr:hypothetical protein [Actinomadura darangshiensis]TDD87330.1 hypothetical protein E1293_07945 [Actinomadura darangshiensis]